jgi:hypothetical protein
MCIYVGGVYLTYYKGRPHLFLVSYTPQIKDDPFTYPSLPVMRKATSLHGPGFLNTSGGRLLAFPLNPNSPQVDRFRWNE